MANTDVKPKEKTKAKKRYLKAKKLRRKSRQAAAPAEVKSDVSSVRSDDSENEEQEPHVAPENIDDSLEKLHRPKKRRKISVEPEDEPEAHITSDDEPIHAEKVEPVADDATKQTTEPEISALPSFPLPTLPDAPSKHGLARQGLGDALLGAEIVDQALTSSLNSADLSPKATQRLEQLGITELFAVQTALLPFLLRKGSRAVYLPYNPPQDVCVSAPTGSGKTLAYAIPIVEILSQRIVTRLRALIILPTRDLVTQVRETFEAVGKGRGLKIATATGQQSFSHEQSQLVAESSQNLQGGSSKVDILICTPGRLIDHLNGTPNFSLQHLRFLVIDEADRLLTQSFQGWLSQITTALNSHSAAYSGDSSLIPYSDAVSPAYSSGPALPSFLSEKAATSCQKLLFSATLTTDPGKLTAINLRNPKYFVVQSSTASRDDVLLERFTLPSSLSERWVVCSSAEKPLTLFYLIHKHQIRNVLIFTKSAESTTRLVKLFEFFEQSRTKGRDTPLAVCAYSSDLNRAERKTILDRFRSQQIHMLVCSDLISRGIDIHHVSHVISYDAPVDIRKYVHRVGRTARAGRDGDAWTLVEEQEARHFKKMLKDSGHDRLRKIKIEDGEMDELRPHYEAALEKLKEAYIRPVQPVPDPVK